MRKLLIAASAATATMAIASSAQAELTVFDTYVGNYGMSTDGAGATSPTTTISAFVPVGATVTAAYLYQANYFTTTTHPVSLNGTPLTFSAPAQNPGGGNLNSARSDVTSIVAGVVDGGLTGVYDFTVNEGSSLTSGTGLVVIYEFAALPTSTIAILDGFATQSGDMAFLNFANPLDPLAPGFGAEMRLGINHSCCDQSSTVTVNGTLITDNAGNFDDGLQSDNRSLITFGGSDDPFSTLLPSYADDHERYNLIPYISPGDTSIIVSTANPSGDDNIFFAGFVVTGEGTVTTNPIPEPATWAMMIGGFVMAGAAMRRRRHAATSRAIA